MVQELGIDVIVPPLHHRIVTARVRVSGASRLHVAQSRLERAIAAVEARYPATPTGLGVAVGWGCRTSGGSSRSSPTAGGIRPTSPSTGARRRRNERLWQRSSTRRRSRATRRGCNSAADDVVFLFRSDQVAHIDDGQHAIVGALGDLFTVTSVRSGFVGGGFGTGPGLAKQMALAAGIPGADSIVDGVQMFLGFTSTQKAAMAPDRIASFETLPGLTDQKPDELLGGGAAMHVSHLNEDLERWWQAVPFTDQLRAMTRPGLTVPDKTYTIAEDVSRVETAADVRTTSRASAESVTARRCRP